MSSVNWHHDPPAVSRFRVHKRRSDWGLPRWRVLLLRLLDVADVVRASRGAAVVVLATMGSDLALFAWALRVLRPRVAIVAFDVLMPARNFPRPLATSMFRAIDRFAVIRRGDVDTLAARHAVRESVCSFVHFPVAAQTLPSARHGEYVYSAGWAHRDWTTLVAALGISDLPAVVAPGGRSLGAVPRRVRVIDMPPPDEGRALAAGAMCVAVAMEDTHLPAGPLVLLDAMAMGKAVVASDVNGVRDYIVDGVTGLLVPPGDPQAMAAALMRVSADPMLRERLGHGARREATESLTPERFWERLDEIVSL